MGRIDPEFGDDIDVWGMDGTYYVNDQLGFGVAYGQEDSDDTDLQNWSLFAEWFVTEKVALALAAVQSDIEGIGDQTALLDDFLHIDEWNPSGVNVVVAVPAGLAYVYHHVLGAYLVKSNYPDRAVRLLMTTVEDRSHQGTTPLWQASKVTGFPDALDGNSRTAWRCLEQLFDKQSWLNHFFARKREFISCLGAYNLIASLLELGEFLRREGREKIAQGGLICDVPPMFAMHDDLGRLVRLAVPNRDALEAIAVEHGVLAGAVRAAWPEWAAFTGARLRRWPQGSSAGEVPALP